MAAKRTSRGGGVGTNQYQKRGQAAERTRFDMSAVVASVEDALQVEAAALAFADVGAVDLDRARSAADMAKAAAIAYVKGWAYNTEILAARKSCPPDLLAYYTQHEDRKTRVAALMNPNCPPGALAHTVFSDTKRRNPERLAAAGNPRCPPEAVDFYARDTFERAKVAGWKHCPPGALVYFAETSNARVMETLASNPSTPPSVLADLASRDSVYAARVDCPPERLRRLVASNPSTPPDSLAGLADVPEMLAALGRNPSTPPQVLAGLVDEAGRRGFATPEALAAAANPSLPLDCLERIVTSDSLPRMGSQAANNPSLEDPLLTEAAVRHGGDALLRALRQPEPNVRVWVAAMRVAGNNQDVRVNAARNPASPPEVLDEFVGSPTLTDARTHREVIRHPNVSYQALEGMQTWPASAKLKDAAAKAMARKFPFGRPY